MRRVVASMIVAMNGPAMIAGSARSSLAAMGRRAPIRLAAVTVTMSVRPTVSQTWESLPGTNMARTNPNTPMAVPRTIPMSDSRPRTRPTCRTSISPMASPRMMRVALCVPVLPPVFMSIGMKKTSMTAAWSAAV
ncbi:MAG: hypothetical protein HYR98_01495 [Nitrospirae bacterium]|nr:hypothetical protein [Nitrospirota bacterium]